MRNYKSLDVDDYIMSSSVEAQPHLHKLRQIIKNTIPDSEEKISWGVPFYWYHGALAGMSYFKHHVSFGFSYALPIEIRQTLETQGYHTGSKTVQIKFDQPVPVLEIQQILKTQARLNETKKAEKVT